MMISDIDQLKDGNVHKEMIGDFKLTEDFKVKVITHFKDNNSKTTLGENNELIIYANSFNKAILGGIFDLEPSKFPVRIILIPDGQKTKILMDDNYGFQKFKGKVKEVFEEKNNSAFDLHFETLKSLSES